jgi:hypothetical protein
VQITYTLDIIYHKAKQSINLKDNNMEMALTVLVYGYFALGLTLAVLFLITFPSYILPLIIGGSLISLVTL